MAGRMGKKGLFDAILAGNVDYMACGERYGHKKELRTARMAILNSQFSIFNWNYSARSNSITWTAALATLVPGPNMAAAPAL